jgi:hypothetical protein
MLIGNVRFTGVNNQYFLIDKGNEAYKVNVTESVAIRILSLTGGKACQFFIFINEEEAEPLAVWENSNFITLNHAIQK